MASRSIPVNLNVEAVEKPSLAKNDRSPEKSDFHNRSRIDDRRPRRHKSSPKIAPQFSERGFSTASLGQDGEAPHIE